MTSFVIEPEFWKLFPDAHIAVVVARGIDNSTASSVSIKTDLSQAGTEALKYLPSHTIGENQVIKVWREAFKQFKIKKGVRSSIEALLKRIHKGEVITSINPLVDIYNTVSLRYALPCGGEDVDTFVGDLRLTQTEGGDPFQALGDDGITETLPGEICYLDEAGAVCRCWNWRDGVRTMLTEKTTNAVLIIESIDPERREELKTAIEELAFRVKENLGGKVAIYLLSKENPTAVLGEVQDCRDS